MSDFQPIDDEDNIWLRKGPRKVHQPTEAFPWVTWVCCIVCAGIFLLIQATGGQDPSSVVANALAPRPYDIWNGAFWGPLSCSFTHFGFFHAAFNIYWLFFFGNIIERHFGSPAMLGLVIAGAILSFGCHMAVSSAGAVGASGINYALFGFLWIARRKIFELQELIPDRIVQFMLFWFVLCFFLTKAGLWPVANGAHSGGLIFGCAVAATFTLGYPRYRTIPALALLFILLLVPTFYAPWSTGWNWSRGYTLLNEKRYEEAVGYFKVVLKRDPADEGARINLDIARRSLGLEPDDRWPPPKPRE